MRIAMIVGSYPAAEKKRRADVILSYARDDAEIGLVEISPSPYVPGFGSGPTVSAVPAFVAGCRQAEQEGYDAVIPLGVLDIGVDEGRDAVGIPVIGAFESAIHIASFLGKRIGVIAYSSGLLPVLETLAKKYRVDGMICGYDDVGIELPNLAAAGDRLEDEFCAAALRLQSRHGAEVIVSAGISLCPLHLDKTVLERRLQLPVVEAIGAPIEIARVLIRLGLRHSRRRWSDAPSP
jgi:allantoin racemase